MYFEQFVVFLTYPSPPLRLGKKGFDIYVLLAAKVCFWSRPRAQGLGSSRVCISCICVWVEFFMCRLLGLVRTGWPHQGFQACSRAQEAPEGLQEATDGPGGAPGVPTRFLGGL